MDLAEKDGRILNLFFYNKIKWHYFSKIHQKNDCSLLRVLFWKTNLNIYLFIFLHNKENKRQWKKRTPQKYFYTHYRTLFFLKGGPGRWIFEHFPSWKPHSCGMAQIKSSGHIERGKTKITILKPNRKWIWLFLLYFLCLWLPNLFFLYKYTNITLHKRRQLSQTTSGS